jgi:DNA-binding Xre family transcriptional regulator
MQAIRNNKPVNLSTIDTICQLTGKRIEEIVEILPDKKEDASE